jgi:hypothetical protein
MLVIALTLAVAVFAAGAKPNKVKSKVGSVQLTKAEGGTDAACTADFNDELTIVKEDNGNALVKHGTCQGWVKFADVEYVAQAAGDKSMHLEGVDVVGWLDNPSAVFVLENDGADFGGVNINRDFREYLQNTEDREQVETKHQEN